MWWITFCIWTAAASFIIPCILQLPLSKCGPVFTLILCKQVFPVLILCTHCLACSTGLFLLYKILCHWKGCCCFDMQLLMLRCHQHYRNTMFADGWCFSHMSSELAFFLPLSLNWSSNKTSLDIFYYNIVSLHKQLPIGMRLLYL